MPSLDLIDRVKLKVNGSTSAVIGNGEEKLAQSPISIIDLNHYCIQCYFYFYWLL
jgi:hypothetical protein